MVLVVFWAEFSASALFSWILKHMQAHDQAIRSMVWSHNDNWMVSGDDGGAIK